MKDILLFLFGASLLIQLIYIWVYFSRLAFAKSQSPIEGESPPVSIVVAARNEYENLQKLVPALLELDYPNYEVIIVDDRSYDETYDYLLSMAEKHEQLRVVRVNATPEHVTGKKYALTLGIKAAKNEILLFTDADCLPNSPEWVSYMVAPYVANEKTELVLGFSPYIKYAGLLNIFTRFETFYVGLQYLSMGLSKMPFMGVGRNISYKKSLFLKNKGFFKHQQVVGGDDDLFVNEVSTSSNTQVVWDLQSQMVSEPKKTWKSWYRQKTRHLSVGQHYRQRNKILLGMLGATHFSVYLFALFLLLVFPYWVALAGYGLRMLSLLIIFEGTRRKIDPKQPVWALPFLDILYILYYIFVGISAFIRKRTSWN